MDKTVVLTYIYADNVETGKFMASCARNSLPVHNCFSRKKFMGNGHALGDFYRALVKLKEQYEYVIYSDGGDTFFLKTFTPPSNELIYSTEKACYPHPSLAAQYPPTRMPNNPWRFLNGGNWCSPIQLAIDFFNRYKLNTHTTDISGQHELMLAYLEAIKEGFPIRLDEECEYFQTIAFEERGDFRVVLEDNIPFVKNLITNTTPSVIHGNGRTPMDWVYNLRP